MLKRILVLAAAAATGIAAFIGTSLASTPGGDVSPTLPAAALPRATLTSDVLAAIETLIPSDIANRYGITSDSYGNTRNLADTAAGRLYVLPGSNGLCIVLLPAASCGDPVTEHVVAVFLPNSAGYWVGGGVLSAGVHQVSVSTKAGNASAPMVLGGFVLTPAQGLVAEAGEPVGVSLR